MIRVHRIPSAVTGFFPDLICRLPQGDSPTVYLTFDDGPMPGPTDFVLDQLKANEAQATFFCIGNNIRKHPQTFQRILDEGHSVGNHTDQHVDGWRVSIDQYLWQIKECESAMNGANTGRLFRPPFGKLPLTYKKYLSGMKIVLWDVLTYDFEAGLPVQQTLEKIKKLTRSGSIIVFHDSLKAEQNLMRLLPAYLKFLKSEGFSLKAVS